MLSIQRDGRQASTSPFLIYASYNAYLSFYSYYMKKVSKIIVKSR